MARTVRSLFAVRSYEVDSYGHLNNGVYVSWFEQGRLDHLRAHGFSYDGFAAREQWFVVRRTEVDFRRPLRVGDEVEMETHVAALGRTSVRFEQALRPAGSGSRDDVVCAASTVMVFAAAGRAIAVPDDFRAAVG